MSADEYVPRDEFEERIKELEERLEGFTDYMSDNPTPEKERSAAKDYPALNDRQVRLVEALRAQEKYGEVFNRSSYRKLIRQHCNVSKKATVTDYMRDLANLGPFEEMKGMRWQFEDSNRGESE